MSVITESRNQPVTTAVHAFVAPVQRESNTPASFDLSQAARFDLANPPSPWIVIGKVENFRRTAADDALSVQAGSDNTVVAQFRKKVESHVAFDLRAWGKLPMALASGGVQSNILAGLAVPVQNGSIASLLKLTAADSPAFTAGDLVVVDSDYRQQVGYIGLGASAAYVAPGQESRPPVDFVRRVSFNVARIRSIENGNVELDAPLLGGDPPLTAAMQKVIGFADREGGAFRQEWSMLFFEETVCGGKVGYYYPRLQSVPPGSERRGAILGDFQSLLLQARLLALPVSDPQDGVAALWQRIYVPSSCGA